YPAAQIELDQLRGGRGVAAFLRRLAHVAHPETEAGLHGVEQRGFADAALAGEQSLPILQSRRQPIDALPGDGARQQRRNAELAVHSDQRLIGRWVHQVRFVQADNRRDAAVLRADEIAVDEVRLQFRLDQRHNDDDLIDVGDENMLAAAGRAREQAVPRLPALDHAFVVQRAPKPDAVAGSDDVALVDSERAQQPSDRTAEAPTIIGLHNAPQSVRPQDAARQTRALIHGRHVRRLATRRTFLAVILVGDDRSPPRQVAFGPHALLRGGAFLFEAMFLELPRPRLPPRGLRAVLPQIDSYFLFLGHAPPYRAEKRFESLGRLRPDAIFPGVNHLANLTV